MKILYVITGLGIGGAEVLLFNVCKELVKDNDVTVVYLTDLTALKDSFIENGIDVIYIDYKKIGFFASIKQLRNIISKGFDIVHTHLPLADTVGRTAALISGDKVKVYSSIHSMDVWKKSASVKYAVLKLFNRLTVNMFNRVRLISVAECVKSFCIKYEKIRANKVDVLYNFADYSGEGKTGSDFRAADIREEGKYTFVNIGRLDEQKGHMVLLKAIDELVNFRNRTDFNLYILGDGDLRGELSEFIEAHNLQANVYLAGFVTNTFDYLKNSDLFIFPSTNEGFGIAAFEAFHCRVPVITSDIKVTKELLVDGEDCVFFQSENYTDLADKIMMFLDNELNIDELTDNAYIKSNGFTVDVYKNNLLKLYRFGFD